MYTHTINIIIDGETPKCQIEAQANPITGELDITSTPDISNTKALTYLNELFKCLKGLSNLGEIDTIEVTKI